MPTSPQARMRHLFTNGITAMDLAEHLVAFDDDRAVHHVRDFLDVRGLRIAGVRQYGAVVGYVWRRDLVDGSLADHVHPLDPGQVVPESAALPEVIRRLSAFEYCFVEVLGSVTGIISRSDIEKPPARMWLFGMITVLEMYMVRAIEARYPEESWRDLLSEGRRAAAEALRAERERRRQQARLIDCLQLTDKGDIFLRDEELFATTGFESIRSGQKSIKQLASLRNNLAHAQGITTHDWDSIVALAGRLDQIMTRM